MNSKVLLDDIGAWVAPDLPTLPIFPPKTAEPSVSNIMHSSSSLVLTNFGVNGTYFNSGGG